MSQASEHKHSLLSLILNLSPLIRQDPEYEEEFLDREIMTMKKVQIPVLSFGCMCRLNAMHACEVQCVFFFTFVHELPARLCV